jgi:hypothetical protein
LRNTVRRVALVLFSQIFAIEGAIAEASGPDVFRVTGLAPDSILSIREAPDAGSAKIGEIPPNGDGIRNLGCQGGLSFAEWQAASEAERETAAQSRWCRVNYQGIEGWVAGRYLAEATPTAPSASRADPTPVPYPAPDRQRTSATPAYLSPFGIRDPLAIRAQPSIRAAAVAEALAGTVLRNYGCRESEGRRWCEVERVEGNATRGWATADYLEEANAALRAGQGVFDAGGRIDCTLAPGQPMSQCGFGVARDGGGTATVVVTRPDGRNRALFFENGNLVGADTSEADGYHDTAATKRGDLFEARVGTERYEIFEVVVFGG